jgi:uncharacterized protein (DUF58 family)
MNNPLSAWRIAWETRFYRWVDKRTPRSRSIALNRKNIYTFPNLTGFMFLLVTLIIWMLGTNYQNNLILALAYLMVSIFVVSILHAFANLAGISVKFIGAKPAFAGELAGFELELITTHKQGSDHLELRWPGGDTRIITLNANEPMRVTLYADSKQRGHLWPGRLLVQSTFPLGIIRCWSWLNLDAHALIYPAPIACEEPKHQSVSGAEEGGSLQQGGDDFSGLRSYQAGDSIKHIAWKQYAQEKGLFTKEYEAYLSAEKWLAWQSLSLPQERRLAGLCFWALEYERCQIPFGLEIPGVQLAPALGDHHLGCVLKALAEFNSPGPGGQTL